MRDGLSIRGRWLLIAAVTAIGLGVACTQAVAPPAPTTAPAKPAAKATPAEPKAAAPKPAAKAAPAKPKAAAPKPAAKAAPAGPTGRVLFATGPAYLDTYNAGEAGGAGFDAQFLWPAYDGLVWVDRTGEVRPALASEWSSDDGITWTFKIREDIKFQDGTPLTADDVLATFEYWMGPENESQAIRVFPDVKAISAPAEYTIVIELKKLVVTFPKIVALAMVVKGRELQEVGDEEFFKNPIGTGPYRFVQHEPNAVIRYEAMEPGYVTARGQPNINELWLLSIPELATRVAALQAGDIDIADRMSADVIPQLEKAGFRIPTDPGSAQVHLTLNLDEGPTTDVRVRQAINYAVNRPSILENLVGGYGKLDGQLVGEEVLGYNPDVKPYPYDPEKAKELLAEAGFADGFPMSMIYRATIGPGVAEAIVADLAEVGIDVELLVTPRAEWLTQYFGPQSGRPSLWQGITNWEQTFEVDPVWRWWSSDFELDAGRRWQNEEFNDLYQKGKQTVDIEERDKIYQEAAVIINEQAPVLFMWRMSRTAGISDRVEWTPGLFADMFVSVLSIND